MKLLTVSMIIGAAGLVAAEVPAPSFVKSHMGIALGGAPPVADTGVIPTFHRIGLAGANAATPANPHPHMVQPGPVVHSAKFRQHGGCRGSLRAKAAAFTNWVRIKFGIDKSGVAHLETSVIRVKTGKGPMPGPGPNAPTVKIIGWQNYREGSFPARINRALTSLGPWEGRAVAFVLGCGIGVLLRMIFVLAILSVRAIRSRREAQTDYYHAGHAYERLEEDGAEIEHAHLIFVAPPEYADEKPAVIPNSST